MNKLLRAGFLLSWPFFSNRHSVMQWRKVPEVSGLHLDHWNKWKGFPAMSHSSCNNLLQSGHNERPTLPKMLGPFLAKIGCDEGAHVAVVLMRTSEAHVAGSKTKFTPLGLKVLIAVSIKKNMY